MLRGWLCLHTEHWGAQGQTHNPTGLAQGSCTTAASSLWIFLQGLGGGSCRGLHRSCSMAQSGCSIAPSSVAQGGGVRVCFCWASGKMMFPPFSSPVFCLQRHFQCLTRTSEVLHSWTSLLPCPEVAASRAGFAVRSLSLLLQQ